jgi:hypothetical protein
MKQIMQQIAKLPKDRQDKILKLAALKLAANAHRKMAQVLKAKQSKPER